RHIAIPQTRRLKDAAQYLPHKGSRRIFLIDHVDRANDQAANSLLKTLEEPPAHLILIMTAENAYDLLPTIRSRAVLFQFAPLSRDSMREFVGTRGLDQPERRIALGAGSPARPSYNSRGCGGRWPAPMKSRSSSAAIFRRVSRSIPYLSTCVQPASVLKNSGNDTDAASAPSITDSPSARNAATANAMAM